MSLTKGDNSFLTAFDGVTIGDLVENRKPYTLKTTDAIDFALSFLADKGIISAPVVNKSGAFAGMIDVKDILDWIVGKLDKHGAATNEQIKAVDLTGTVEQVVDSSSGYASAFLTINPSSPAVDIVAIFANSTFHRVVCYDPSEPSKSVLITRSDITRFLYKKLSYGDQGGYLASLCDQTVEQVKLFSYAPAERATLYGVKSSSSVITALRYLKGTVLSALPIVEGDEKDASNAKIAPAIAYTVKPDDVIAGIFTASLLKGFTLDKLPWLTQSVSDFSSLKLDAVNQQSISRSEGSVRKVLELMHVYKLHRVWVLDSKHPIGVITAGDIIRWFYTFNEV